MKARLLDQRLPLKMSCLKNEINVARKLVSMGSPLCSPFIALNIIRTLHWHAEDTYMLSAVELNSLAACNDQGLVAMSTQFLLASYSSYMLIGEESCFLRTPAHPPARRRDLDRLKIPRPLLPCLPGSLRAIEEVITYEL